MQGQDQFREDSALQDRLRRLPSVDRLLSAEPVREWLGLHPRDTVAEALRRAVADERERARAGEDPDWERILRTAKGYLDGSGRRTLRPVLNATGVVLHTNLGRAPLSQRAIDAVAAVCRGYSNLEYDLEAGSRGSRHLYCEDQLRRLTGAEAAMVVNNNAAAVLLVLSAHCRGREVIISRGELVEIGGSFRIPDVLAQSGCVLREVGTTNRTHLRDYERAVGPDTAAVLKVHTSNYRIEGFTKSVPAAELAAFCRERGLLLIEDLGSGVLLDTRRFGLGAEPAVVEAVQAGCDLVTFSGDKLLGGPQAGIILGKRAAVQACKEHPLARAVRVDKMTLAALQATLDHYLRGETDAIPLWRMLSVPAEALAERARRIAARLRPLLPPGCSLEVVEVESAVGGGSLPGRTLPSAAVSIALPGGLEAFAARLRAGRVPVVGRIEGGRLLFDLRTVAPEDDDLLAELLGDALAEKAAQPGDAASLS